MAKKKTSRTRKVARRTTTAKAAKRSKTAKRTAKAPKTAKAARATTTSRRKPAAKPRKPTIPALSQIVADLERYVEARRGRAPRTSASTMTAYAGLGEGEPWESLLATAKSAMKAACEALPTYGFSR